jgi:plastocyanin
MFRYLSLAVFAAMFSINSFAHQAFTLVSSEKFTVTQAQLDELQKQASVGKADGANLTFSGTDLKLVFTAGPEDDMFSYRVQGMRNPNIVTPGDVRITVWFVNTDDDMPHDLLFSHYVVDFPDVPDKTQSAGTQRVRAHDAEAAPFSAEKIVITSNEDGAYRYFCSVKGHAKGGMWGNILVGVKAGMNMPMPEKPSQTQIDNMPGMKPDTSPTPKKPDDMSDMPGMNMAKPTPTPTDMSSMPGMNMPKATPTPGDMSNMPGMHMPGMKNGGMNMKMSSVTNIGDPMERESSGTAWAPDSSPMYGKVKMNSDGSMCMFMATAFVRYTQIGSSRNVSVAGRGDRNKFDAPTMLMAMYSHPVGKKSQFGFRVMASLDPIFERGYGYPLLYQSGEEFGGEPIHDRQHPHDLISELAVTFSHKFDDKHSFYLYAGYPGEPALGPPMYLHRSSGMNNPDAPIGHHWQDATHITFGVITAGFSFGKAKIEASSFKGREPDANRWNFDHPKLDSFSGRFSFNPTKNWALQISHGYLKNPEESEPDVHILRRTTASAIYNKEYDDDHDWATTVLWGQNYANRERSNSFLAETNYAFYKNDIFGRFETVQKSGHDLVLGAPAIENTLFTVNMFSAGYVRDIAQTKGIDIGVGGKLTLDHNPSSLSAFYGGTSHGGWELFMRFRPSRMH